MSESGIINRVSHRWWPGRNGGLHIICKKCMFIFELNANHSSRLPSKLLSQTAYRLGNSCRLWVFSSNERRADSTSVCFYFIVCQSVFFAITPFAFKDSFLADYIDRSDMFLIFVSALGICTTESNSNNNNNN